MNYLLAEISYQPIQRWHFFGFSISPHGVGTMLGFLFGAVILARLARKRGVSMDDSYNAVTWGALGAILGARGFYVLAHTDRFSSLVDVLAVWEGGLTMLGGFVGGLIAGALYVRARKLPLWTMLEASAPGFAVGVVIGRIGDLIIGDHLGDATNFFLGYKIPEGADLAPGYGPPTYIPGAIVHQTALYDMLGAALLLIVLVAIRRRVRNTGVSFALFSFWYGIQRFLIDFTRNATEIDSSYFGITGSQWTGIAFALFGVWAFFYLRSGRSTSGVSVPEGGGLTAEYFHSPAETPQTEVAEDVSHEASPASVWADEAPPAPTPEFEVPPEPFVPFAGGDPSSKAPDVPPPPPASEAPASPSDPPPPAVPSVPQTPSTPEVPSVPQTPATPAVPSVPQTPTIPEVPSVPQTPATPAVPSVPQPPATPETPSVPSPPPASESYSSESNPISDDDSSVETSGSRPAEASPSSEESAAPETPAPPAPPPASEPPPPPPPPPPAT